MSSRISTFVTTGGVKVTVEDPERRPVVPCIPGGIIPMDEAILNGMTPRQIFKLMGWFERETGRDPAKSF